MTLDDFFTALTQYKDQVAWQPLTPHASEIRGIVLATRPGEVHPCCPLTAVATLTTGLWWDLELPATAGGFLELEAPDVRLLVSAADSAECDQPGCSVCQTRARLLACLGLQESAED